jgi:amidohydrolase
MSAPAPERPSGLQEAKSQACAVIDQLAGDLVAVSHRLHAHPELAWHERRSASLLASALDRGGLRTERGACGLPTSFAGRAGTGGPLVVICCEYDALPGLGHACGHNVIAAAGLGAGLALARLAERLGGRVTVLGTPAEERGGGKILLLQRGAFDGAHAALLAHPSSEEVVMPPINANTTIEVVMLGRAAHASMHPEQGVNALDALVLGYMGIGALRQHLVPTDKVHGIVTYGGSAPNVVPARAAGRFMVRSADQAGLRPLRHRVLACFQAGADAAGASMRCRTVGPEYAEMWHNLPLAAAWEANAVRLGRRPGWPGAVPPTTAGSTDMGNVSQLVPAIHPKLAISPPDVAQHSPGFAVWATRPAADRAVIDAAKALAMTTIDVWLRPELRAIMCAAFDERRRASVTPGSAASGPAPRPGRPPRAGRAPGQKPGRKPGPTVPAAGWPGAAAGPGR